MLGLSRVYSLKLESILSTGLPMERMEPDLILWCEASGGKIERVHFFMSGLSTLTHLAIAVPP